MKIHEYQGRELLAGAGVPVPDGSMVMSVDEAVHQTKQLLDEGAAQVVIKAQVHAGGRGKASLLAFISSSINRRYRSIVSPNCGSSIRLCSAVGSRW